MTAHAAPQDSLDPETLDRLQCFADLDHAERVETLVTLMQVSAEIRARVLSKHVPSQLVRETVNGSKNVPALTAFKEWWTSRPRPGALVRRSTLDGHPDTGEPIHIHREGGFALDVTPDTVVRASTTQTSAASAVVSSVVPEVQGLPPFD